MTPRTAQGALEPIENQHVFHCNCSHTYRLGDRVEKFPLMSSQNPCAIPWLIPGSTSQFLFLFLNVAD